MTKLTAAHLKPLAAAFEQAMRERAITVEQAEDFCAETFTKLLEHKVRVKHRVPQDHRRTTGDQPQPLEE